MTNIVDKIDDLILALVELRGDLQELNKEMEKNLNE